MGAGRRGLISDTPLPSEHRQAVAACKCKKALIQKYWLELAALSFCFVGASISWLEKTSAGNGERLRLSYRPIAK
jgi:hypothetical protein